ncbi:MAG: hypothetical protein ACI8WB_001054 [Phenylobacterium sp.]|jgi:hypothetical protein
MSKKKKGCFASQCGNSGSGDFVTFNKDIEPAFAPYRNQMMWRLDLTNYEAVKENAQLIWTQIESGSMPPPPREPFSQCFLDTYQQWMKNGCPQ